MRPTNFDIFCDNAVKREILNLTIKCDYHENGCEWISELRNREAHKNKCQYVKEACPNECGEMVIRKETKHHKERLCSRRVTSCDHCNMSVEWVDLQDHYRSCLEYPVDCINFCGQTLARCEMDDHTGIQGNCPNSIVPCIFRRNGCSFEGICNEVLEHIEINTAIHLSLIAMELQTTNLKLENTEQKLADTESRLLEVESQLCEELTRRKYSCPPVLRMTKFVHKWRIENWSERVAQAQVHNPGEVGIQSSSFYVYPGYHLFLTVYPVDFVDQFCSEKYVGVYLFATDGEFDEELDWPFAFALGVVDQQAARLDVAYQFLPPYHNTLSLEMGRNLGHGNDSIISHRLLQSRHYIKDDSILIKLTIDMHEEAAAAANTLHRNDFVL